MFKKIISRILSLTLVGAMVVTMAPHTAKKAEAINPIVQDVYTADPAPMVCSDGRVYLITSHDEDVTVNGFFTMNDWKMFSTTDMVNWQSHGTVLGYQEFSWAKSNSSWAAQMVERDGQFYVYVPINHKNGTTAIGVAVGDSPTGPFEDPLGAPLVGPAPNYIDPTCFIDDDGQAYLYWGNPDLFLVKLNDDMISYDKSFGKNGIKTWEMETKDHSSLSAFTNTNNYISSGKYADDVDDTVADYQAQFGVGLRVDNNKIRRPTMYEEGPWFYKRDDKFYMVFAANGIPERIDYSMSDSPTGPWEYQGMIMDDNVKGQGTGSFTNHPGVIDYKDHSYLFYHTGKLPGGGGYKRSVAVEEITYNEDGTINPVPFTTEGVEPCDVLNPYNRVEAETIYYAKDIENDPCSAGGINVTHIEDGDYIQVKAVDFTEYGAVKFTASTASDCGENVNAGAIEVYLDSMNGEPEFVYDVDGGADEDDWIVNTIDVDKDVFKGEHDVFFKFTGEAGAKNLFKFDYWQFTQDEIPATPSPVPTAAPTTAPVVATPTQAPADINNVPTTVKVSKINVNKKKVTLKVKKSFKIKITIKPSNATNKKVAYKSSNKKVAKVSSKGIIKALKKGKAVITVTAKDGSKKIAKITVKVK